MITAQVCNPHAEAPFRCFVRDTVTHVCLPPASAYQLYVEVEEPAWLKIEIDGKEIHRATVDPTRRMVQLADVLATWTARGSKSFFDSLRRDVVQAAATANSALFSVVVCSAQAPSAVAATFNFRLLPPEDFEAEYNAHLAARQELHVTDWQQPADDACWNCGQLAPDTQCSNCGADRE